MICWEVLVPVSGSVGLTHAGGMQSTLLQLFTILLFSTSVELQCLVWNRQSFTPHGANRSNTARRSESEDNEARRPHIECEGRVGFLEKLNSRW
ncbi:uncharacterized protein BDZ99DRAFT_181132 [Mytilinidion resinicola]|uniref:Uncharacterized protein n=1 Tax=Mytilinidion resinicola TaxID=574789 RepID=A0A6A6Z1M6_9PEZI|nr:uncharacterized protein BDZ99DRAFT_181132 [Mytilinidion resinicola]KAF2814629.1 hypothetical protein BDZ99DRAFT_181132 [Mytilinidion resinicola]